MASGSEHEPPARQRRDLKRAPMSGDVVGDGHRHAPYDEDEADEGPSESDIERFGGVTQTCPECGTEVYDEAAVCWSCGHAIGDGKDAKSPPWAAIVVAVVIGAFLLGALVFAIR